MPATKRVTVIRRVKKRLDPTTARDQVQKAAAIATKGDRGRGWTFQLATRLAPPMKVGDFQEYRIVVQFKTTTNRKSVAEKFDAVVERFAEACCAGPLRSTPWIVTDPDLKHIAEKGKKDEAVAQNRKERAHEVKELGDVNLSPKGAFGHIYDRQPQINRIQASLELGQRTNWESRVNSVLDGPPGCGKTEIMRGFANMLGPEGTAYRWFDATAMTKAGVVEELIGNPVVPPVLFIEEIEKCEENALRWLLGVMDIRGQIRRLNYRTGPQCENVRMVVIATANDVDLLEKMMSGALYSRFQQKIYCPRPGRKIMERILKREIKKIQGKEDWISPALEFGVDKWGISDPRDIITICTVGGDRLLNGSFQKDYEDTMHPKVKESLKKALEERGRKGKKAA